MTDLPLTIAMSDYDHVRDLADGRIRPVGIDLTWLHMDVPEIFARFSAHREWHVSEFGLGKYAAHRSSGDDSLTAIPVFPSRIFRLTAFYVREDSPLTELSQLAGKKVGIPEWAQTACIYAKGYLGDEAGVALGDIEWIQAGVNEAGRAEKVRVAPPDGVVLTPAPSENLNDLLLSGGIDAMLSAQPPSAYETGGPVRRLLGDAQAVEADYLRRTGILPIMHTVAIRRDVMDAQPWVAQNLLTAFEAAKKASVARALDWKVSRFPILWGTQFAEDSAGLFGDDYWPYGVDANRPTLETFLRYCDEQGITQRRLEVDELFAPATLRPVRV